MATQDDNLVSIKMSSNRLEATLVIQPGIDPTYVNSDVALAKALSQAIQPGPRLSQKIAEALKAFEAHDLDTKGEFRYPIAQGQPCEDGKNGKFTLEPELDAIYQLSKQRAEEAERKAKAKAEAPAANETEPAPEAEPESDPENGEENLDHHERTTLMVVKAGQRIGVIQYATEGIDGTDVCGGTIRARPGTQAPIKFDSQTIECHDNGLVLAKIAGQLVIEIGSVHICPTLVIGDYVDYSTGNIDFPGNIEVHEGVRDCFEVSAGKSITIRGLVEAANLMAARDAILQGGISGREKGTVHTGRDIIARYLNGADCKVGRDLVVEKEICDCNIVVTGNVRSPSATIMGGHLSALGSCDFKQVGSEGGTKTAISLGRAESLEEMVRDSVTIIKSLSDKVKRAHKQINDLRSSPDTSSIKAEMMTSLQFEASEAEAKMEPLRQSLNATYRLIKEKCEPVLTVQGLLCLGVEIRAGGHKAKLKQTIKGPLSIRLNDMGEMVCLDLRTGAVTPMKNLATVSPDETSYSRADLPEELRQSA